MRLLLKRGNAYSRIFKVTFNKGAEPNRIVGTWSLFDYLKDELPCASEVDMHFTYFRNGNYHFSYKYFDNCRNVYIDHKLYHNHVAIYEGATRDALELVNRRNRVDDYALDMFMMGEPISDWSVRPVSHHFGSIGMSFTQEGLNKSAWINDVEIDIESDLIIDVDDYPNSQVSFGLSFYNVGHPHHDPEITPWGMKNVNKILVKGDLAVNAFMVIVD